MLFVLFPVSKTNRLSQSEEHISSPTGHTWSDLQQKMSEDMVEADENYSRLSCKYPVSLNPLIMSVFSEL